MESPILRVGAIHELKTWRPFFQHIIDGIKTFDIRENDRGYQVGDVLRLREFIPDAMERTHSDGHYTGRSVYHLVVYKLDGALIAGLEDSYCVLGLSVLPYHIKVEIRRDSTRPALPQEKP